MVLAPDKALPNKKEDAKFTPGPAASYRSHQTSEKVTIGVLPYFNDEDTRPVFGKHNPYTYGVQPVLVVIQNDSDQTIRLDKLRAEYVGSGSNRVEATPAQDVRYSGGANRPTIPVGPIPSRIKKSPLNVWEIEGRALAAQVLPPGQTASGFLYFQTGLQPGSVLYLNGLVEAGTGKELLYFEIPLK